MVVVDDAHWADRPSLSALLFALRRLVADQVLVLIGVRDAVTGLPEGLRRVVDGQAGAAIALPGLAEPELRDLAAQLGSPLSPVAARRLRDGTRGNPLHARALLAEFPAQSWGTGEWPLPSPRSFRLVVKDRWSGCSAAARDLVDAAAVLGMHSPLPQVASLAGLEEPLAPLDETTAAGLIAEPGPGTPVTVAFPHPLVRSAVHDSLGVARRSALHAAAAALVAEPAAVLRHRVAAATVPDAALAADLEAFARREADRQAWPAATASLVEAARQSPQAADRQRRVLEAVTWMLQNGDAASAAAHRGEIADFAPGAQRDSVLGALAMAAGRPAEAGDPPARGVVGLPRGHRSRAAGHDRPPERDALLRPPRRRGHGHVVRAGVGAHRPGHGHPLGRQHLPRPRPRLRGPHRRVVRRRRRRGRPGLRLAGAPLGPRHPSAASYRSRPASSRSRCSSSH